MFLGIRFDWVGWPFRDVREKSCQNEERGHQRVKMSVVRRN